MLSVAVIAMTLVVSVATWAYSRSKDGFNSRALYLYAYTVYFTVGVYAYVLVKDQSPSGQVYLVLIVGLLAFAIGDAVCPRSANSLALSSREQLATMTTTYPGNSSRSLFIVGILLALAAAPFVLWDFRDVGLLMLSANIDEARGAYWEDNNGFIVYLGRLTVPAYICLLLAVLRPGLGRIQRRIGYIAIFLCVGSVALTGSRGAMFAPATLTLFTISRIKWNLSPKRIIYIGLAAFCFLGLFAWWRWVSNPSYDVSAVNDLLRLPPWLGFCGPMLFNCANGIIVLERILEHFDVTKSRLGMQMFNAIYSLMPGYQPAAGVLLKEMLGEYGGMSGGQGLASTTLGTLFIDFWYLGVVGGMFSIGLGLRYLYYKSFENTRWLVTYGYVLGYFILSIYGNLFEILLDPFLLGVLWMAFFAASYIDNPLGGSSRA